MSKKINSEDVVMAASHSSLDAYANFLRDNCSRDALPPIYVDSRTGQISDSLPILPLGVSSTPYVTLSDAVLYSLNVEGRSEPKFPVEAQPVFTSTDATAPNLFSDPRVGFFEAQDQLAELRETGRLEEYAAALGIEVDDVVSQSADQRANPLDASGASGASGAPGASGASSE